MKKRVREKDPPKQVLQNIKICLIVKIKHTYENLIDFFEYLKFS